MPSIPWPWTGSASNQSTSTNLPERILIASLEAPGDIAFGFDDRVASVPPHMLAFAAFCLGSASTLGGVYVYRRHFKRILNADWVTPDVLRRKRLIKGLVTSVGDADNFRIYHTPGFGWRWPLKYRFIPSRAKDLKDQTIHIRIAGVDAPEAAHFGRPAQAFAEESLAWLKKQIEGKMVYCQLLRRDQYGRIVATVYLKPRILPSSLFLGKPLALEMLRAGWVEVYELSGAEYGRWGKEEFLRIQAEAQAARRGMWKHGTDGESPADYKRRYASSSSDAEKASSTRRAASTDENGRRTKDNVVDAAKDASWVRRLFWRIRG